MADNPFSPLLNLFGGGSKWTMPPVSRGSGAIPQPAPLPPAPAPNPMNAYFTQLADPRYRKAMQSQNLFSNLLDFGAQMSAAGAPSLDPGYAGRTRAGAWAGLGKGLMSGNQAHQNQLIQAIKLKQLMRQNEMAQAEAKRKAELFPLQKAKLKAQTVPKPMFGTGVQGRAMEIWSKANDPGSDPSLKQSSQYKAAVSFLSRPTYIQTPEGVREIAPILSASGQAFGGEAEATTTARPKPTIVSQTAEQKLDLTPAEKSIDLAFGKQYSERIVGGGQADFDANVGKLESVLGKLKTSDSFTGPFIGSLPQGVKEVTHPEAAGAQELVEEVVQRNLRIILGAQFTEKEGERLIKRAYNPRLEEPQNIERLKRLINSMKKAREAQMAANEYFQKNGTLKGYEGTKVFSLNSIERDAGLIPGESDEEIGPPPKGVTLEEWRAMPSEKRKLF